MTHHGLRDLDALVEGGAAIGGAGARDGCRTDKRQGAEAEQLGTHRATDWAWASRAGQSKAAGAKSTRQSNAAQRPRQRE